MRASCWPAPRPSRWGLRCSRQWLRACRSWRARPVVISRRSDSWGTRRSFSRETEPARRRALRSLLSDSERARLSADGRRLLARRFSIERARRSSPDRVRGRVRRSGRLERRRSHRGVALSAAGAQHSPGCGRAAPAPRTGGLLVGAVGRRLAAESVPRGRVVAPLRRAPRALRRAAGGRPVRAREAPAAHDAPHPLAAHGRATPRAPSAQAASSPIRVARRPSASASGDRRGAAARVHPSDAVAERRHLRAADPAHWLAHRLRRDG